MAQTMQQTIPATRTQDKEFLLGTKLKKGWATWRRKPLGVIGGVIVVAMVILAIFAPSVAPNPPGEFVGGRLQSPSSELPLGTDSLGRDVFSRTIYGAQISMAVGLSAAVVAIVAGAFFGIVSGYTGGVIDMLVQRSLEVLASFPGIVLALILVSILGRADATGGNILQAAWSLRGLEVAIAVSLIFGNMRVIRAATLRERNLAYIEAARSIGAPTSRILWRHVLPNVMPYIIVAFSSVIGSVILIEAALSFLGYGVASGTPSWGGDLSSRNREFFTIAPWLMIGPGVALSLTVLGFNFLGDALRDILDPRLRGSR